MLFSFSCKILKRLSRLFISFCLFLIWESRKFRTFSIIFKSGDCGGQSINLMFCSLNHPFTALAVCGVALSCWNIVFDKSIPSSSASSRKNSLIIQYTFLNSKYFQS